MWIGGGLALCLRTTYCHYAWTNFTRGLLGVKDGFSATAVMEIYEETDTAECDG